MRDEILQQFRDGTLQVYVPVYDDVELVHRSSRGFSPYTACLGEDSGFVVEDPTKQTADCEVAAQAECAFVTGGGRGSLYVDTVICKDSDGETENGRVEDKSKCFVKQLMGRLLQTLPCQSHGGSFSAVQYKDGCSE